MAESWNQVLTNLSSIYTGHMITFKEDVHTIVDFPTRLVNINQDVEIEVLSWSEGRVNCWVFDDIIELESSNFNVTLAIFFSLSI